MCGIAGFFNIGSPRREFQKTIESMTGKLVHRGPDASGWWADPDIEMVLGHRRLSILDLSESGIQPMHSESGRFVISFNGEIYNFRELRVLLKKQDHHFKTGTDTEVMLAAIEEWGIVDAVKQFRGMFAFAIYDRSEKKCYLVRDRFGIKPCYYARVKKGWMFASQIGAIRQCSAFEGTLDHSSLGLFLLLNHVPDSHCAYKEASKVSPGEIVCFDVSNPSAEPVSIEYWNTGREILESRNHPIRASEEECIEWVKSKIAESVKLRMIADVPLGAFLSGGIDSSLVVALMQESSSTPVNTFTIRNEVSTYDEGDTAKAFAKHIGTNHTELMVTGKEAAEVLPLIADIYDEPFSDASQIPTYLVSKLARSAVTVSLSGDGGDEVFGGYNRYFRAATMYERYQSLPRFLLRGIAGMIRSDISVSGVNFLNNFRAETKRIRNPAEKLAKSARCLGARNEMQLFLELLMQYHEGNALIKGMSALDWKFLKEERGCNSLDGLSLTEQMMYQDTIGYLPNDILTKLDRASMAVALESRVPLLDHELFQLSWRLRPDLKIRKGNGKWILKKILEPYLPEKSVLGGEKQGFAVPLGDWFRGDLKPWLCDTLSKSSIDRIGLLDFLSVERLITEHLSRKKNHENILWSLLVLHMWMEKQ